MKYLEYNLDADLAKGEAVLRVDIFELVEDWDKAQGSGFKIFSSPSALRRVCKFQVQGGGISLSSISQTILVR